MPARGYVSAPVTPPASSLSPLRARVGPTRPPHPTDRTTRAARGATPVHGGRSGKRSVRRQKIRRPRLTSSIKAGRCLDASIRCAGLFVRGYSIAWHAKVASNPRSCAASGSPGGTRSRSLTRASRAVRHRAGGAWRERQRNAQKPHRPSHRRQPRTRPNRRPNARRARGDPGPTAPAIPGVAKRPGFVTAGASAPRRCAAASARRPPGRTPRPRPPRAPGSARPGRRASP